VAFDCKQSVNDTGEVKAESQAGVDGSPARPTGRENGQWRAEYGEEREHGSDLRESGRMKLVIPFLELRRPSSSICP
jgi:hypothetical protein